MLLTKGSREDAIHSLINTWLKDQTKRCGWCGEKYNPITYPCCEQPFIATNLEIFEQFFEQIKFDRASRKNKFSSTDKKQIRWALSMPPGLLQYLIYAFKMQYDEDLFNDKYTLSWFTKKFKKYFAIPEVI